MLKAKNSIYSHCTPQVWPYWLAKGPTNSDHRMALVVYIDNMLLFRPDKKETKKVLIELSLRWFELMAENKGIDKVYDFPGINTNKTIGIIKLTQQGLIKKILECVGMFNSNKKISPCSTQSLDIHANVKHHDEDWEYASTVSILIYSHTVVVKLIAITIGVFWTEEMVWDSKWHAISCYMWLLILVLDMLWFLANVHLRGPPRF